MHRYGELVHQEKRKVTRHRSDVEILRKDQNAQNDEGRVDFPPRQAVRESRFRSVGPANRDRQPAFVPVADPYEDKNRQQCRQSEPTDRRLSERNDDQRGQQGPHSASGISADLEDRLCQSLTAARGKLRHPRGFGMEHRRTAADQPHRNQNPDKTRREGKHQQPGQRETHTAGQRVGAGMTVGEQTGHRLQQRRSELKDQCNEADLGERKIELLLEKRINRRDHRLHHIVQQMGDTDHQQNRVNRPARQGAV